ncbi:MAG: hypothetical protein IJL26_06865 [Clostridia bacterium]|nr:hypothetical protein [Clostridia bacterium]
MKKTLAILLALVLTLGMAVPALAETPTLYAYVFVDENTHETAEEIPIGSTFALSLDVQPYESGLQSEYWTLVSLVKTDGAAEYALYEDGETFLDGVADPDEGPGWMQGFSSDSFSPGEYRVRIKAGEYTMDSENTVEVTGEPVEKTYSVGDIISFGGYPQTRVTDEETVAALEELPKCWRSYGYYSGTGEKYDGNMQPGDWMRYADVLYNGIKYRAVTFDTYRPTCTGFQTDLSIENTFQAENGYTCGNTYYFKWEPLQWRVLDPTKGLVMSESIIDAQEFQNTAYYADSRYWQDMTQSTSVSIYKDSSIRSWLINDFYNTAFSSEEQSLIGETDLRDSIIISTSSKDKVLLLGEKDVLNENYGFSSNTWMDESPEDPARYAKGTDYAKCQGLSVSTSPAETGNSSWWLRISSTVLYFLPGLYGIQFVDESGVVYDVMNEAMLDNITASVQMAGICNSGLGVRPAFQFLSGIMETSNPVGGSDDVGHVWDSGVVTKEATCAEEGEALYTCAECGETKTEPIPVDPDAHDWSAWIDQWTDGHIKVCRNDESHIIRESHTWTTYELIKATCTSTGILQKYCVICTGPCGSSTIPVDPSNHGDNTTHVENAKEATCAEAGYTGDMICDGCGEIAAKGETVPKLAHSWDAGVVTKAATCKAKGTKLFTCTECGATKTEPIAKDPNNHASYGTVVKNAAEATCEADGYTGDVCCKGCGAVLTKGETIPAVTDSTDPTDPTDPADPTDPTDPAVPSGSEPAEGVCPFCGMVHPDTLSGRITYIIHCLAYLLQFLASFFSGTARA